MTSALLLVSALLLGQQAPAPAPLVEFDVEAIAPGVHVARPVRARHGFVEPNVTFVIGASGVLVVDAGFLPSTADVLTARLREITDLPVRYLVNTHWHGDHHHANARWRTLHPGLRIIAHAEGRREIVELGVPDLAGFVETYRARLDELRRHVAGESSPEGDPNTAGGATNAAQLEAFRLRLPALEQAFVEVQALEVSPPDETYVTRHEIDLGGGRLVELSYAGRANTAGDAVVRVPDAGVLITGDIVVAPRPYLSSDDYAAWTLALERLERIDARVIVPGHGAIQHDMTYLRQLRALMSTVLLLVDEAAAEGLTLEQTQARLTRDAVVTRLGADWNTSGDIVGGGQVLAEFVRRAWEQRRVTRPGGRP